MFPLLDKVEKFPRMHFASMIPILDQLLLLFGFTRSVVSGVNLIFLDAKLVRLKFIGQLTLCDRT